MSEPAPAWIGAPPRPPQVVALMLCGVTGLMMAGLQPLLLGALAGEGRLAASELGQVATAELLCMGLTAGIAGALLPAQRLRLVALFALLTLAVADVLTPFTRGSATLALRAAAGVPSGLLVWITISLIARTPTPERWAGAFVTAQTLGQLLMSFVIAALLPRAGADGGFLTLAILCAVNAAAALLLPPSLAPLPKSATGGLPDLRGWAALSVSFFLLGATSAAWVYLERFSAQAHHDAAVAGQAVSLSLAFQVAGGLAATVLAGRVSWFRVLLACAAGDLAVFAGLLLMPPAAAFFPLAALMGFIWLFATPFLVPMTIEADPTRRAALLIGGAQLVGGSLGPLCASFFVTDADARGALGFSLVYVAAATVILLAVHLARPRSV
ncbi:MFS transporter [Terricaulis sp.]|uniref:MFS transporter n=1 Tax=Terricaulis sp. TaxID=2768686 RepID=UPI003784640D